MLKAEKLKSGSGGGEIKQDRTSHGAEVQSVRRTSSGLRPPSPQSGEGTPPGEAETLKSHSPIQSPQRGEGTIVALNNWLAQVGVAPVTAWRWRRKGWLKTVNIMGRVYITDDALREFKRRAEAGEFAKEHKAPKRRGHESAAAKR
jgi:hypothetical protein